METLAAYELNYPLIAMSNYKRLEFVGDNFFKLMTYSVIVVLNFMRTVRAV